MKELVGGVVVVHMSMCFAAHGNRGVSARQIFTHCVVLPPEVRRSTSPFVNRAGERRESSLETLASPIVKRLDTV